MVLVARNQPRGLPAAHAGRRADLGTQRRAAAAGLRLLTGSTLRFERWHRTVFSDAEHGMIDLLIHGGTAPPPLRSQVLFEEGYACLVASAGCATPSRTRCDKARQRPRTSKNEMAC
jgi:hypothetical protein